MLQITRNECPRILQRSKIRELEKHLQMLEDRLEEVHELKGKLQELKLEQEENMEEIEKLTNKHETKVQEYDAPIEEIQNRIMELKQRESQKRKAEVDQLEEERLQRRYNEERKLETMKFEVRQALEKKAEMSSERNPRENPVQMKLPNFIISKFEGRNLDWLRFWSQFEMEIDRPDITAVSKFSYLKELVIPKVRAHVDRHPFNTEGYERAKAILKAKLGKPSEATNTHIQCILFSPIIAQNNVIKIHDFYEKLVNYSQALDTMGKLKEINGYVRMTSDKLPAIYADLVRIDNIWEKWDFGQFIEALRKWTDRNPISLDDKRNNINPPRKDRLYKTSQDM